MEELATISMLVGRAGLTWLAVRNCFMRRLLPCWWVRVGPSAVSGIPGWCRPLVTWVPGWLAVRSGVLGLVLARWLVGPDPHTAGCLVQGIPGLVSTSC